MDVSGRVMSSRLAGCQHVHASHPYVSKDKQNQSTGTLRGLTPLLLGVGCLCKVVQQNRHDDLEQSPRHNHYEAHKEYRIAAVQFAEIVLDHGPRYF